MGFNGWFGVGSVGNINAGKVRGVGTNRNGLCGFFSYLESVIGVTRTSYSQFLITSCNLSLLMAKPQIVLSSLSLISL